MAICQCGFELKTTSSGKLRPAAIVVLGARIRPDGTASAALDRRMRVAISLYRAGVAPLLVLSGGGRQAVPEAEVMRQIALAEGVPAEALIKEPRSQTTVDNAMETAELMSRRGEKAVALVTDSYHVVRARLLFRIAGLTIVSVHGTTAPMRSRLSMSAAECVKLPVSIARAIVRRTRRKPQH